MPKPACVKCQRFYRVKKNGYLVCEMMPTDPMARPGTVDPSLWEPYKIWHSDLWVCEGCGHELVAGYGRVPSAEHHDPHFMKELEKAESNICDC